MPVVDLDEVQLFYTDSGDPAGPALPGAPALVLVHGWTCDSHDWLFQHDVFAAQHRVVALDLRGHGRSSVPREGWSPSRHARDVVALLDHLGLDTAVVVGHSLGGAVAAALCVEHPDRVLGMVGVEPAYGQDEELVGMMRGACDQFDAPGGNELAAQLVGATEPATPTWLRTWHRRRVLGVPPALLRASFEGLYFDDEAFSGQPRTDAYLARRATPTLAFHRLPDMGAWEEGLLSHPDSRVVTWEGAGHWLHQVHVEAFNELVLAWVSSLGATTPSPLQPDHQRSVVPA